MFLRKFIFLIVLTTSNCVILTAKDSTSARQNEISVGFVPSSLVQPNFNSKEFSFYYKIENKKRYPYLYIGFGYNNSNKKNEYSTKLIYPSREGTTVSRFVLIGLNYNFWTNKKNNAGIGLAYLNNFCLKSITYHDITPYTSIYRENSNHLTVSAFYDYKPLKWLAIGVGIRGIVYSKFDIKIINSSRWQGYTSNKAIDNMPLSNYNNYSSIFRLTFLTTKFIF